MGAMGEPRNGTGAGRRPGEGPGADDTAVERRFGVFYPTHHVVALLPDAARARAAAEALERAGWAPPDVHRSSGAQAIEGRRRFLEHRTVIDRLGELVSSVVADEREARDEYLEAAARGAHFLLISTPTAEQVRRAQAILAGHDAWGMRHYGDAVVTDLPSAGRATER
jgi:hypothetical protein